MHSPIFVGGIEDLLEEELIVALGILTPRTWSSLMGFGYGRYGSIGHFLVFWGNRPVPRSSF